MSRNHSLLLMATLGATLSLSSSAYALSTSVLVGKDYTDVSGSFSIVSVPFANVSMTGSWTRSDHDGQVGSLGLKLSSTNSLFSVYTAEKLLYLSPENGDSGVAFSFGLGGELYLKFLPIYGTTALYGEAGISPGSFSAGNSWYHDGKVGLRYTLPIAVGSVSAETGYRVMEIKPKDSDLPNDKIANGWYVGLRMSF